MCNLFSLKNVYMCRAVWEEFAGAAKEMSSTRPQWWKLANGDGEEWPLTALQFIY